MNQRTMFGLAATGMLFAAGSAFATKTQFFSQKTRADFEAGTLDSLVVTNFGQLKLARALETVLDDEGKYASIDSIAEGLDSTLYVGTNASGQLLAVRQGKATKLADFGESAAVTTLAVIPSGDLLVGVSGEKAALHRLKAGAHETELVVELPDAQYIWGMAQSADGKIYLATGPSGVLYEIDPAAKTSKVIFDSEEDNLRTVVSMNDTLFVGTDPNGLVLKIDRKTGKATVVFDAPETEISTLLLDPRSGQLYAATSQLVEGEVEAPADESSGHPSEHNGGEPLFNEPAAPPEPKPGDEGNGDLHAGTAMPALQNPNQTQQEPDEVQAQSAGTQPTAHGASPAGPVAARGGAEPATDGNAVYRIDSQGFVSEIFRDQSMILAMSRLENSLLIATGPKGTLYQLDLASEEHTALAKTRSQMLTSVFMAGDKSVYIGSGLSATLSKLSSAMAKSGTITSSVLDASQVSAFGKVQVRGSILADTGMTVSTRSSNVSDADSPLWSAWSEPVPAARFTSLQTPPGRYLQYRVTLTGDSQATPTLDEVSIAYLQPNVAPRIDSIAVTAEAAEEGAPQPLRTVSWVVTEPNGDALRYSLFQRTGANGPWVLLAKDLTDVTWQWDTRKLADGRYEVKVEASDALANAAGSGKTATRISEAIDIDNTPPAIGDINLARDGGKVTLSFRAADRGSVVAEVEYSLDGDDHWQRLAPSDMLNDSPDEQYALVLPEPESAAKTVSLRCRDESGNTAYESVLIRPAGKQ